MSKTPSINLAGIKDPAVKQALTAIAEQINLREGRLPRQSQLDKGVTWRDLVDKGVMKLSKLVAAGSPGVVYAQPGQVDFTIPPAPTGFSANGAMQSVILEWDQPPFANYAYTEIWRSETDDLGTAVKIGTSVAAVYVDSIGDGGRFYYWIRFVSQADIKGPFNAVAGTLGETSYDPGYVLDLLTIKWEASTAYAVGDYVIPTPAKETGLWYKCTVAGTSGSAEPAWPTTIGNTVTDGTVTWEAVAAGADIPLLLAGDVNGTPTLVVSGDLFADGTIVGRMVKAGSISADKISVVDLSAISANLGSITGGSLNINDKFIVDSNGNLTVKSGTTGARMEASNSVIKVYDSNGVKRVQIGDLTA